MIALGLVASAAVGIIWCQKLRGRPDFFSGRLSWPLVALLVFQCVLVVPLRAVTFRFYFAWNVGYLFAPDRFPRLYEWAGAWSLLYAVAGLVAGVAGYAIGSRIFSKPRSSAPVRALGLLCLVALAVLGVFWREFLYVGSALDFASGNARLIVTSPLAALLVAEGAATYGFLHFGPEWLARIPEEASALN